MATIMERVQDIVADKLAVEKATVVSEASFIDDLNADSLDLVELIMAFEEEFSTDGQAVEISDDDAGNINTIKDAVDYLKGKGASDA